MYYKVFYTRANNEDAYWIGNAHSKEDAIKKADVLPKLVSEVWILDEWFDECDSRRGIFLEKDLNIKNI